MVHENQWAFRAFVMVAVVQNTYYTLKDKAQSSSTYIEPAAKGHFLDANFPTSEYSCQVEGMLQRIGNLLIPSGQKFPAEKTKSHHLSLTQTPKSKEFEPTQMKEAIIKRLS